MKSRVPALCLSVSILGACHSYGAATAGFDDFGSQRKYELGRVDTTAIVQLYADGFDQLKLSDKILAYHLAQAAIAGRDIAIDQRFAYDLAIRYVLESLWLVREELPADVRAEVERYTQLFWVHNGIHNNLSTKKELLRLDRAQFDAAIGVAQKKGMVFDAAHLAPAKNLDQIHAICTDAHSYVSVTDKSPEGGGDPVAASCNNLYVGCTSADLENFTEHYGLNSRVVKRSDGTLEEQVYRSGDGKSVPPGLYADRIAAVNGHLRDALPFAPAPTKKALELLIKYNETGESQDWRAFNIAWVQDKDSVVDFALGFIEVYLDVRGIKGAWQAVISFRNEEKTHEIAALAQQTQWFEDHMPWEARFKKAEVKGISARAISVITETGDCGPITPIGVNLPNEADIRRDYGSKSVNLSNVVAAYDRTSGKGSAREFSFTAEEAERAAKYASAMDDLHTNLHEVVGHASGQVLPEVRNPAQMLGTFYSTLEEGRADLVGLYWIADQKLRDMGLVPDDDAVLAKYEAYTRNALLQLRRVPEGGKIEEDHMRNRQMIVHWLMKNSDAIAVEHKDGKTYYRVTSIAAYREGCGKLLAEVMRIKATGDFKAGKALVETYGTKVDPALRAEVVQRLASLNLPSVTGFVQPELKAEKDAAGKITDVQVWYPCDLADQMLRWSGRRR
ncbi:MAG: peptidase M49 [Planctomycetes bacterium]|nr:peptidase M49 [Planctomycetota bacterium]MCB9886419.1 peptidase M49 [Planctomycetota bacterium]